MKLAATPNFFARALLLLCLASGAALAQQEAAWQPSAAATVPADTEAGESSRQILLTFTDRSLLRTTNTRPGQYYRRNYQYQTTTWSRSLAAEIAHDYLLSTVMQWPIRALDVHCVVYEVDAAQSVDAVIAQLRNDSRVKSVQLMNTFRALGSEDPYKPLQTSFNEMQVEGVHHLATGAGVKIAIIDTGVDVNHPDLGGQVTEQVDLTTSASKFEDDMHGTAIAGIIGALSDNGLGIEGIAPDASLLALRACWPEQPGAIAASCNSLSLARALDTAILLKPGIVNLSLTGPPDPLIADLLRIAQREGIIIVAAEPEAGSAPGFIAGIDGIIRVRSTDSSSAVRPARPEADTVTAPGSDVLTTLPHGIYNFVSGSSFAAANVSGIIALLLELQPGLSSHSIEKLLSTGTAQESGSASKPSATSVNVCRVAARLRADLVCADRGSAELLVQKSSAENINL